MMIFFLFAAALAASCNSNNGKHNCNGNQVEMNENLENSRWQTPPRGSAEWKESYQGYSHVVAYARIQYKDTNREAATVTVVPTVNPRYNIKKVSYEYNGVASDSEVYEVSDAGWAEYDKLNEEAIRLEEEIEKVKNGTSDTNQAASELNDKIVEIKEKVCYDWRNVGREVPMSCIRFVKRLSLPSGSGNWSMDLWRL